MHKSQMKREQGRRGQFRHLKIVPLHAHRVFASWSLLIGARNGARNMISNSVRLLLGACHGGATAGRTKVDVFEGDPLGLR